MRKVKVAIIGAGTAGLTALARVRHATEEFVIINAGAYGTTCARVGCMPSKALIHIANNFHRRKGFGEVGIRGAEALGIDIARVLEWVRAYRDGRVAEVLGATDRIGDRNIPGRAEFLSPNELRVLRADSGEERIRAQAVVIATGSQSVVPAAWRSFAGRILSTDTLFEQKDLPRRIAVLGLGSIGLEIGQALARLGLEVHGFEMRAGVAALTDPALAGYAAECFAGEFFLHLGRAVEIRPRGDAWVVDNGEERIETDAVLAALGRRPNLDGLGLERIGATLDARGVPEYDPRTLRIGDLPVYIAGDANADRAVMHEASDEGFIAACNAIGGDFRPHRRVPLTITFTDPEIVMVGARFADLPREEFATAEYDFSRQGRAIAMRRAEGHLRVYAARGSGRLLGAEMVAPEGEHLGHLLALAIDRELTVAELLRAPVYHPVLEEGLRSALRALARKVYKTVPLEFETSP